MSTEPRPPRYSAMASEIARRIEAGDLREEDRLPSERELGEQFGVSRVTVRRALNELADAGLIQARPGRGSFVAARRFSERPNTLMSFTEMGALRGFKAGATLVDQHCEPATLEDSDLFGVAPGSDIFVLERVRLFDGLTVSVELSRIPVALAPELLEVDFGKASLYESLEASGHRPVRAEYSVHAMAADVRRARLLGVEAGFPLLMAQTTAYDSSGQIVEKGLMAYRGDRYRFQTELTRPAHGFERGR